LNTTQIETQYYTAPEIAKILKTSKSFIYDMIKQGKLKAIKISERRTRIPASAIEEFTKEMDNEKGNNYNKVVQHPKRGSKPNGTN